MNMPTAAGAVSGVKTLAASAPASSWRDWYMVVVLMLFLILSFIDRTVLALLVGPIKADLGLSDTQVSLLLGVAFAALYTIVGVPAGYLVDRFNRRNIIFAGLVIWTVMTGCAGFASSFALLFFFRTGVGVGEAVLSPASYSMIRDTFPMERRARAFSIYNLGIALGGGASLLLVGLLTGMFPAGQDVQVPGLGAFKPWQLILAIVGFGGLPVALLALTLREPRAAAEEAGKDGADVGAAWQHVKNNLGVYVPLVTFNICAGIAFFGYNAWIPTAIIRIWGVAPKDVGVTMGMLHMIASPIGLLLCGVTMDWVARRGGVRAIARLGAGAVMIASVLTAGITLVEEVKSMWILLTLQLFLLPWASIIGATALSSATPGRMMGKISAIGFIALNLVGLGFGPTIIAAISDNFFSGPRALGYALALVGGGATLLASLAMFICARSLSAERPQRPA